MNLGPCLNQKLPSDGRKDIRSEVQEIAHPNCHWALALTKAKRGFAGDTCS